MVASPTLSQTVFAQAEPKYVTTPDSDRPQSDNDWEQIVSEGIQLVHDENRTWWGTGDLAARVVNLEKRYAEQNMEKFCGVTKLGKPKSMYEAAQIALFFPEEVREKALSLKREHWRLAYRRTHPKAGVLPGALDLSMKFIEQAEDDGWSAAKMDREMAAMVNQPAKQRFVFEPEDISELGGYIVLHLSPEEVERIKRDVLPLKSNPTWKPTFSVSVVHQPHGGI